MADLATCAILTLLESPPTVLREAYHSVFEMNEKKLEKLEKLEAQFHRGSTRARILLQPPGPSGWRTRLRR